MFAAKAGAKKVIGVDMSGIIDHAQVLVKENGFEDKITLIKGKMEEVQLPVEKVDIIISEWMGYCLLYETMLNTVLVARDKYLAPGGLIFPDQATMFIAGIEDGDYKEEKIAFWENVYGFNFKHIQEIALKEPLVDTVNASAVSTTACAYKTLDLYTCKIEDLTFKSNFEVTAQRDDYIHAFIAYFDIKFSACHVPIVFGTGPKDRYTHVSLIS